MSRNFRGRRTRQQAQDSRQGDLFEILERSTDAKEIIRTMLDFHPTETWRGLIATPPGSLLEKATAAFKNYTDIPLEIPFIQVLHFLSAWLLGKKIKIDFFGTILRPDLWTVLLAESGSSKTLAASAISKAIPLSSVFPDSTSAAKWIEDLEEHNNELWIRDEFAQLLKAIETQTHMAEMKDYMLRLFDGTQIARRTKHGRPIVVDDPALTILGMTVFSTFTKNIPLESMLDGFCQRFCYVIADPDPSRPFQEYAFYDLRPIIDAISSEWQKTAALPIADRYEVGHEGREAFEESFRLLFDSDRQIPQSFYRRILWRSVKYALLYHILLFKTGPEIDAQDMGWAARMAFLHISDCFRLIETYNVSDLERKVRRAEAIKAQFISQGRTVTPRDVVQLVWGVQSVPEARAILELAS